MTTTTPTGVEERLAYSVFFLVETDGDDYELELLTDLEVEATDPIAAHELLESRVIQHPELKKELSELCSDADREISLNYHFEYGDECLQFIEDYWELDQKEEND